MSSKGKNYTYKDPYTRGKAVPQNSKRACLCPDGESYHIDCCGQNALQAQGIGKTMATPIVKEYLFESGLWDCSLEWDCSKEWGKC